MGIYSKNYIQVKACPKENQLKYYTLKTPNYIEFIKYFGNSYALIRLRVALLHSRRKIEFNMCSPQNQI